MRVVLPLFIVVSGLCYFSCGTKQENLTQPSFTRADSVADIYLKLQDSLLQSWNIMINDDNNKLNAMHDLLHELMVTHPEEHDTFYSFEERLEQLMRMRFTQKTMANTDVIEEYDFASQSLINELVSMAESKKEFAYNTTLQLLVDRIRMADERVVNYRIEYDNVVDLYNAFLEQNKEQLLKADHGFSIDKKPQFQLTSDN